MKPVLSAAEGNLLLLLGMRFFAPRACPEVIEGDAQNDTRERVIY
jgi:hypothetical protein